MEIFNQQNFPKSYLGKTKFTIARWGCLDTVLTMIYDYIYDKKTTPDIIAQRLEFNPDGNLLWPSLQKIGLKLKRRIRYYDKALIDASYKNPDEYIALEVKNSHWVWVIGRYIPFLGYRIVDPLHGDRAWSSRYKKITGHAIIIS